MQRSYQLMRRLAAGGMGEVFVARAGDGPEVALKLLLPHLASSPELVERFHAEATLAARMRHPNIVEIFEVGELSGRPFIAMQLVEGPTLARLTHAVWSRGDRMPLPIVRFLAAGLCDALAFAHELTDEEGHALKVVHRDVTPGNLLVSRGGAVLLSDFGIARVGEGTNTAAGALVGKAAWVAPEQVLHDARVDARADLYSAGLVLFEALTGTNPFRRESVDATLKAVQAGELPPVERLRDDVTPGLANGLHRALARRVVERIATARELKAELLDGPVASQAEFAAFVGRFVPPTAAVVDPGGTRSVVIDRPTRAEPRGNLVEMEGASARDRVGQKGPSVPELPTLEGPPEPGMRSVIMKRPSPPRRGGVILGIAVLLVIALVGAWLAS